ncbi:hypothetical protein FQZ97_775270 [compost metagenome]
MTQPPKMSPLALQSAGIGMTLSTSSMSVGRLLRVAAAAAAAEAALEGEDMGTI